VSDVAATVDAIARLAAAIGGPVLELGVGTGRIAVPLAARGVEVHGVDASAEMLRRLADRPGGAAVQAVLGPMDDPVPEGPFAVVFVAFNTFFNLLTTEAQQRCMRSVAGRLLPGGSFVVEASVPGPRPAPGSTTLEVRSVELDRVVLVATAHGADGVVSGQHIELGEGGIRLRPWRVRMASPEELDQLASAAGLRLVSAWSGWRGEPFDDDSVTRIAVYRPMR
jgi:SAM-dependent methyltransferase